MSARKRDKSTIIVRRDEIIAGGHHGGAWKVAYADFVTAMMAFFLLMWLLNATTEEQKRGLADYFSPTSHLGAVASGSGAPFGGRTMNSDGQEISDRGAPEITRTQPYPDVEDDDTGDVAASTAPSRVPGTADKPSASDGGASAGNQPQNAGRSTETQAAGRPGAAGAARTGDAQNAGRDAEQQERREELARHERQDMDHAAAQIRQALAADPALAEVARQLVIDMVPEGMRIQLLDAERTPMFATGSSALNDRARAVLSKVAPIILQMPEKVSISGHTDATPYRGGDKTNWDLSAERANATRRLLMDAGLPEPRLQSVTGNADRDPLIASDPMAPGNRRISITLLRQYSAAKK